MRPAALIFAAVDAEGRIRFIDDVPSGLACGCFCYTCGSPLVARKGEVKIPHFGHQAKQERPECVPGAMNLLRRLAAEYLQKQKTLVFPPYERQLRRAVTGGWHTEDVNWKAQPVFIEWVPPTAQDAPIAHMLLDNGVEADLTVTIGERPVPAPMRSTGKRGLITFWSTLPVDSDLRKELYALQHIRRCGEFFWIHQPDVFGLLAAAERRMQEKVLADEQAQIERARRQQERFNAEYAAWRAPAVAPAPAPAPQEENLPAWARGKKKFKPFIGYRLKDGSCWCYFELEAGGYGLRRLLPEAPDWAQEVPERVGRYDAAQDLVIAEKQPFFGPYAVATRISTDFRNLSSL